ncbi:hypothetical protein MMA231_01003 [Asticcacaulis sp. MM231]
MLEFSDPGSRVFKRARMTRLNLHPVKPRLISATASQRASTSALPTPV